MIGPGAFVEYLAREQYHPRSDAHGNAVCQAVLSDLLEHCLPFAEKAKEGEVVAKLNHTVTVNYHDWNIDLALGAPPGSPMPPMTDPIRWETPVTIQMAVEIKGVMTEHGKARRNRLRDLQAFHHHAHIYNPKTVAGGVVVINLAEYFWSPLRGEDDITHHHDINTKGPETIGLFRSLPLRHADGTGEGLEGACVLAVKHDNLLLNKNPPDGTPTPTRTRLVTRAPAPGVGDPLHYATMIQRLCTAYRDRWC